MKVRYNGKCDSYSSCDSHKLLTKGMVYEVEFIFEGRWQTNYKLNGLKGEFNSVWFDEIEPYMAVSKQIPVLGERYRCKKVTFECNAIRWEKVLTSEVSEICYKGNSIYEILTQNSIYIVTVLN